MAKKLILREAFLIKKAEETNLNFVIQKYREAGYDESFIKDIQERGFNEFDLDLIGLTNKDLPFDTTIIENERDWVDPETGKVLLPAKEIPMAGDNNWGLRPEPKLTWYNGHWFKIHYFHDGSVVDVEMLNENEIEK